MDSLELDEGTLRRIVREGTATLAIQVRESYIKPSNKVLIRIRCGLQYMSGTLHAKHLNQLVD